MTKSQRSLISFTLLASLLMGSPAATAQNKAESMEHKGAKGTWFPAPTAKLILADVKELKIVREQLKLIDTKLDVRLERLENCKEMTANADEARDIAVKALDDAVLRAEKAEARLEAWYRHPALWVATGVVVTILLEIVAVNVL